MGASSKDVIDPNLATRAGKLVGNKFDQRERADSNLAGDTRSYNHAKRARRVGLTRAQERRRK